MLYEVLLEEYETHCPQPDSAPPEAASGQSAASQAAPGKAQQPRIPAHELKKIHDEAERLKNERKGLPDNQCSQREDEDNSKLVSAFFTELVKAQKLEAEQEFERRRVKYDQSIKALASESTEKHGNEYDKLVERAVVADMLGVLDDEREKQKRKKATEAKEKESGRDASSEDVGHDDTDIEKWVLESLSEDEQPSGSASDLGNGKLGNGAAVKSDSGSGGDGELGETAHEARKAYARTLRSALCLSGGGIRSATFNLGILQGLARHGLLDQFDYLSTVSGGGFIGSFITAWMHRRGTQAVVNELTKPPQSPIDPEPHPINHLRVFSNYLSPQPGLLSADMWTLIATFLRNLLMTWLVFVPVLLVALMVPRLWIAIVSRQPLSIEDALWWSYGLGMVAGWFGLTNIGFLLAKPKKVPPAVPPPHSLNQNKNREAPFLWRCLVPSMFSASAFATYWAHANPPGGGGLAGRSSWLSFVEFTLVLFGIPVLLTLLYRIVVWRRNRSTGTTGIRRRQFVARCFVAAILCILVQVVIGALLFVITENLFTPSVDHWRPYATFSVPLLIAVLMLDCMLVAGFTSGFTRDDEMEWGSRAFAWTLIVIVAWSAAHLLVLFGPKLVLQFGAALSKLGKANIWSSEFWESFGKVFAVVGGVISGVITLLGGFSAKTPATGEQVKDSGIAGRLLGVLTTILAPMFLAFLFILIALGTNWLLASSFAGWLSKLRLIPDVLQSDVTRLLQIGATKHAELLVATPLRHIVLTSLVVFFIGALMGLLINSNKFSLHYMWRDRIIRAYLGASRRWRNPDSFTGFDEDDNLYMYELRPQPTCVRNANVVPPDIVGREEAAQPRRKLFHVLNIALNLAGGDKLAWQDRKAESFTVSPLHAGSYWLGYRRSFAYGGDRGISLGTATAISGAFVSPNMGYMMTSPIVRFIMTLFNVRFGWWLGNPGRAGNDTGLNERFVASIQRLFGGRSGKPFELRAPRLSVRPIIEEAFGKTNDKSPYVYLSDGGHFENLGLYEMVLRRCRFIVVSDASSDAAYSFDSLAQSIRQIRVDLGVPIDIREMSITTPSHDLRGKYCAVGRIRYSCVDRKADDPSHASLKDDDFDGTLIYIKASVIGDEPRDVINYGRGSKTFPQEIIVDQWFSEAQFESYRALGSHIIDAICSFAPNSSSDLNQISMVALERKARQHNQLNFRVFKERISYAALINQFRRMMPAHAPERYKARVRRYFDELLR
jgi:hypothetical protein